MYIYIYIYCTANCDLKTDGKQKVLGMGTMKP